MEIIDNLTNEKISKKFTNQFDLVNYAIKLADDMIRTGRSPRVKMQTENPALLILEEIAEGKDQLTFKAQEGQKEIREEAGFEIEVIEEEVEEEALSE